MPNHSPRLQVFLWPARYPGGALVTATASEGEVRVEYEPGASWIRLYPTVGLRPGATVAVTVARR